MNKKIKTLTRSSSTLLFGAGLLTTLTGCIGYVDGPRHRPAYAEPPPVYVESRVVVQDDYIYYPSHQVYYSSSRNQYVYRRGFSWVSRPVPPRVSVDVLLASPSVRLDFRDSPSRHHSRVVKQYPKHWKPPGHPSHGQGNQNNGRGKDRGERQ
jgi:hypothetical protein